MPLIGYFKGQPNEYVIKYSSGRIAREGQGLAFFYLKYKTQIVAVPTSSMDANLVFNEVTSSFQTVTIQGQFTYRIHNPKRAAELLNFTMNPFTHMHISNDPDRLAQRITNIIQMETRGEIQQRPLQEVLTQYETIAGRVLERVKNSALLDPLGADLLSVYFVAAKPTPEVAKALEAEYRETLLRKADMAISARRAAAVEEERKIKENELNTEITLEEQRRRLIDLQGNNALQEATNHGKALEEEAAYRTRVRQKELDLYTAIDPRKVLALAMTDLGQNAGRIGNLTITSEILAALLDGRAGASSSSGQE
jgi:SPFH domain / Band 7 family